MKVRLFKTYHFEAAHYHPLKTEKNPGIHGHRFYVHVSQQGQVDPAIGWLVDYGEISQVAKPLINELDHRYLNDVDGIPDGTCAQIERWITSRISTLLPFPTGISVTCRDVQSVEIIAQPMNAVLNLPERKTLAFEAAHFLPQTPPGHKCRRLHGHSYRISVICEFPDLLSEFYSDVHAHLDHRLLNDIPGFENPTAELVSLWIWKKALMSDLGPSQVVIEETCESCCIYNGDQDFNI